MEIVGYADRLSAAPGETVAFMVSTASREYHADIVRLIHGDDRPGMPGLKEEVLEGTGGSYAGQQQRLPFGSYVEVPDNEALHGLDGFTLHAWVCPTTPDRGLQGIIAKRLPDGGGWGLVIDEDGCVALLLEGEDGAQRFSTGIPLRACMWYCVAAAYDRSTGAVTVSQRPWPEWPVDMTAAVVQASAVVEPADTAAPLLMGALAPAAGRPAGAFFNGKIEAPCVWRRALGEAEIAALTQSDAPPAPGLLAAWDFAASVADVASTSVSDVSGAGLHGRAVNTPARAMTGHAYTGDETDFKHSLTEYGAIAFHEDDLDDARWEVGFTFDVPEDLRSGVYAARLRCDTGEDYVPFFVRAAQGRPQAPILFLAPTNSYLAYANEHLIVTPELRELSGAGEAIEQPQDRYAAETGLLSLYDKHIDGTGNFYSSRLRPIVNMRPKYYMPLMDQGRGAPHQFNADLHLVDWMEQMGHEYDVAIDEDLHREGAELLANYRVVVLGSHPEYWSEQMLTSMTRYLESGGRLLYLGGNGLYWVTSYGLDRPHVIEVRKRDGIRAWEAAPGEYFHSTTGELGGLWRRRGRAPQRLVGVGTAASGFATATGYRRLQDSFDPRADFIFEGIGADEIIGEFGSVLGGAASYEIDRFDHDLGTPPHALLLATSTGHTDEYQHAVEELLFTDSQQGGTVEPRVRADMTYFEWPSGGAVFSTGSVGWCGSLSHNGYDNNVSTVTDNVLRRFCSDEPLPTPPSEVGAESHAG